MHEEEKGKEKKEKIARKGEDKRRKEKIKKESRRGDSRGMLVNSSQRPTINSFRGILNFRESD